MNKKIDDDVDDEEKTFVKAIYIYIYWKKLSSPIFFQLFNCLLKLFFSFLFESCDNKQQQKKTKHIKEKRIYFSYYKKKKTKK